MSPNRVTMILGLGLMGEEEDVEKFCRMMVTDFERRAHQVNEEIFSGRLQLLPLQEEHNEVQ